MTAVPEIRIRDASFRPVRGDGRWVLYWMTAHRRTRWSFALDRAVAWARQLGRPLVVLEHLPCGRRWDTDRSHAFVLQGMADNAAAMADAPAQYYPYVDHRAGDGEALAAALAAEACVVVADEFPDAAHRALATRLAARCPVLVESVDANGLLPLAAADRAYPTAHAFRRWLQRTLPEHLHERPQANPFARLVLPMLTSLPASVARRWPRASARLLRGDRATLAELPIDHAAAPAAIAGGRRAALRRLKVFVAAQLPRYADDRNHPDLDATSGLSPYLHAGHLAAHEVAAAVLESQGWSPERLSRRVTGSRQGWWGVGASAEAFLDQAVTWREVGFNMAWHREDHDHYESLPPWAARTLGEHARDRREYRYGLREFEQAGTHDRLWNAAQRQLVREGRMHNYLWMLWGKKILQWTQRPQEALEVMIELNNRYALDGCDPNSYSGVFWVLGRYDRAWGPERPVFGKVRFMSSDSTRRKVRVKDYLERYGDAE
ncbi:MAG TPA: deoxyribodipyrimidine photolyase [Phycisphaerae bacterium]|nr:deoxyribodipyrimidine photolyase [Phycisphaerae bacterium]